MRCLLTFFFVFGFVVAALNNNDGTLRTDIALPVDTTGYTVVSCSSIVNGAANDFFVGTLGRTLLFDGCSAVNANIMVHVDVDAWASSGSQVDIVLRNPSFTGTSGAFVVTIGSFTSTRLQNCVGSITTGTGVRLRIEGGTVSGAGYVGVIDASWCGGGGSDPSITVVSGLTVEVVNANVTAGCTSTSCIPAACSVVSAGTATAIAVVASTSSCAALVTGNGTSTVTSISGAVAVVPTTSPQYMYLSNSVLAAVSGSNVTVGGANMAYSSAAGVGVAFITSLTTVSMTRVTFLLASQSSCVATGGQYAAVACVGVSVMTAFFTTVSIVDSIILVTKNSSSTARTVGYTPAASAGVAVASQISGTRNTSFLITNTSFVLNDQSQSTAIAQPQVADTTNQAAVASVGAVLYANSPGQAVVSLSTFIVANASSSTALAKGQGNPAERTAAASVAVVSLGSTYSTALNISNTTFIVSNRSTSVAAVGGQSAAASVGAAIEGPVPNVPVTMNLLYVGFRASASSSSTAVVVTNESTAASVGATVRSAGNGVVTAALVTMQLDASSSSSSTCTDSSNAWVTLASVGIAAMGVGGASIDAATVYVAMSALSSSTATVSTTGLAQVLSGGLTIASVSSPVSLTATNVTFVMSQSTSSVTANNYGTACSLGIAVFTSSAPSTLNVTNLIITAANTSALSVYANQGQRQPTCVTSVGLCHIGTLIRTTLNQVVLSTSGTTVFALAWFGAVSGGGLATWTNSSQPHSVTVANLYVTIANNSNVAAVAQTSGSTIGTSGSTSAAASGGIACFTFGAPVLADIRTMQVLVKTGGSSANNCRGLSACASAAIAVLSLSGTVSLNASDFLAAVVNGSGSASQSLLNGDSRPNAAVATVGIAVLTLAGGSNAMTVTRATFVVGASSKAYATGYNCSMASVGIAGQYGSGASLTLSVTSLFAVIFELSWSKVITGLLGAPAFSALANVGCAVRVVGTRSIVNLTYQQVFLSTADNSLASISTDPQVTLGNSSVAVLGFATLADACFTSTCNVSQTLYNTSVTLIKASNASITAQGPSTIGNSSGSAYAILGSALLNTGKSGTTLQTLQGTPGLTVGLCNSAIQYYIFLQAGSVSASAGVNPIPNDASQMRVFLSTPSVSVFLSTCLESDTASNTVAQGNTSDVWCPAGTGTWTTSDPTGVYGSTCANAYANVAKQYVALGMLVAPTPSAVPIVRRKITRTRTLNRRKVRTRTQTRAVRRRAATRTKTLVLAGLTLLTAPVTPPPAGVPSTTPSGAPKKVEMPNFFLSAPFSTSYAVKRFMVSTSSSASTVGTSVPISVLFDVSATSSTALLQLITTTSAFDYVTVGGLKCANNFVGGPGWSNLSLSCGDPAWCYLPSFAASPGTIVLSGSAALAASTPSCNSQIFLFGTVAIDGAFTGRGVYAAVNLTTATSTSNVTMRGSAASNAAVSVQAFSTPTPRDEATLSVQTPQQRCDYGDIRSFTPSRGIGVGATKACLVTLSGGGTRPCATLAEYHYQCAASAECVGYSVAFEGPDVTSVTTERGLFLHTTTYGFTPEPLLLSKLQSYSVTGANVAAVMFYAKPAPSSRTCTFRVTASSGGTTSLYLQQTTYSTASAIVYVTVAGSKVALAKKQCGALQPFIRSSQSTIGKATYLATDGQCSVYALCYETGQLPSGSVISVVASHDLSPGACNQSLSVIANFTAFTLAPGATMQPTAPPRVYNDSVNTTGLTVRSLSLPLPSPGAIGSSSLTIKMLWSGVTRVALKVVQTAWDCSATGCPARGLTFFAPSVATGASPPLLTACGGALDFFDGPAQGSQCALLLDCMPSIMTIDPSLSTGIATINVNVTLLRSYVPTITVGADCLGFQAQLFVTSTASVGSTFPLASSASGVIAPLLATLTTQPLTVKAYLPSSAASFRTLLALGPYGEQYNVSSILDSSSGSAWAADGETAFVATQRRVFTSANVTFACVADTLTQSTVTCRVPIPIGANWMRVRVMQNDFATNAITVSVLNERGTALTPLTRTCGGDVNSRFVSTVGRTGACDVYSDCIKTFLSSYSAGSAATGNATFDFATVQLSVPNTVQPQGCDVALSALITFAANAVSDVSKCTGYVCVADLKCIANTSVCDGAVSDCSDGADEATCGKFQKLEVGSVIARAALTPDWVASTGYDTVTSCRWLCVFRGCSAFSVESGVCTLYTPSAATQFFAAPSQYLIGSTVDTASVVYGVLQYTAQYQRCSKWLLCSDGRGTIHNAAQLKDGDTCTCDCIASYTGVSCGTLKSIAAVGEYIMLMPKSSDLDVVVLAAAFAAGNSSISITIKPFRPYNTTVIAVPFQISSDSSAIFTEFTAAITSASYVAAVNAQLDALGLPRVVFPMTVDAVTVIQTLGPCNATTGTCGTLPSAPVAALSVTTAGIPPPYRVRIVGAAASSSARGFAAQAADAPVDALCGGSTVVGTGSSAADCPVSTCVLQLNFTGLVKSIQLISAADSSSPPSSPTCATPGATLAASSRVDVSGGSSSSSSDQSADPRVTVVVVIAFLQAGAVLFAMLGVFAGIGFVAGFLWSRTLRRTRVSEKLRQRWSRADLPQWVRDLLTQMTHTSLLKRMNLKQVGIMFSIFVVMSGGIGGAMMVLYQTEQTTEASFGIVVNSFSSPACGGASVTTLPFQTAFVDALETQCQLMVVAGLSTGPQYAKAKCIRDASGNGYTPLLALAGTLEECDAAAVTAMPAAGCVPLSTVAAAAFADAAGTWYLSALCFPVATGQLIFSKFKSVAPVPNATTVVDTSLPSHGVSTASTATTSYTSYPVAADGNALTQSTSSAANRLSSIATNATFWGAAADSLRVVVQPEDAPVESIFRVGSSAIANLTNPIEAAARPILTALPVPNWHANQTPSDGDYPVGFVFNNFGTVDAVRAEDAYVGAHRYTGLSSTLFDVGQQYGPSASGELDGYTISMWLRASRTTDGFAFVLCDHFEDRTTRESYVVRKLTSIARDGVSSNQAWFAKSFHVYSSLYVAGPSASLNFMFADPSDTFTVANSTVQRQLLAVVGGTQTSAGGSVQKAYWDLTTIGQEHLFNGAWHHVAIVLQNVNRQPLAKLIVDGITSTDIGWQQCLDRRPQVIASNRSSVVIPDDVDANTVSALDGGALYVGYFNGGVRGLQFDATPLTPPTFIRSGTRAMKVRGASPKATLNVLAYAVLIMVFFIIVLSVKIIVDGAIEVKKETEDEHERLRADWNSHIDSLFPAPAGYAPMVFDVALTVLKDTPESVISQLVAYCVKQPLEVRADGRSLAVTAVRVLWLTHQQQQAEEADDDDDGTHTNSNKKSQKDHENDGDEKGNDGEPSLDTIRAVYPTPEEWSSLVRDSECSVPSVSRTTSEKKGAKVIAIRSRTVGLTSVFQNVLTSCQSALLYALAFRLPRDFLHNFLPFLEVTGFDIFSPLQLSTVEKLIAFYTVMTVALVVLAFVLSYDQRNFFQMALRYMVRRNRALRLLRRQTDILETIVSAVDEDERRVSCPYQYGVATLGRNVRARVHEFSTDADRPPMLLTDGEGSVFTLHHVSEGTNVIDAATQETREATTEDVTFELGPDHPHASCQSDEVDDAVKLMPVVCRTCPEHSEATLQIQHQDPIKPYRGRYGCCALEAGKRCGRRDGTLFVCREAVDVDLWRDRLSAKQRLAYMTIFESSATDAEEDAPPNEAEHFDCTCNYALCEEHFAASTGTNVQMKVLAALREFTGSGFGFIVARIVIFVAFAMYTPVMQNSIMVVSCHTYFQCQFPHCWNKVDSSFGSAAYVALLAIVLVGVGFPGLLLFLLYQRESAVDDVFLDTRYDGQFMEVDADNCTAEEALEAVLPNLATRMANLILRDTNPKRLINGAFVPSSSLTALQRRQRAHTLQVQATAWADFFDNDKSLLGKTYEVLRKECMAFAPIMTLVRFAILVPALATSAGLVQYASLAGGALGYAMWMAITQPYRSRFVHLIDNAGITLQLALIGWQSFYSARVNDTDTDDEQNAALTSTMAIYFAVVTCITLTMIVRPALVDAVAVFRTKSYFKKLGLNDFSVVPVFLAPTKDDPVQRRMRGQDEMSERTRVSSAEDEADDVCEPITELESHDNNHFAAKSDADEETFGDSTSLLDEARPAGANAAAEEAANEPCALDSS